MTDAIPLSAAIAIEVLADVVAERARQIKVEGWTPEHDDLQTGFELARLAAAYAQEAGYNKKVRRDRARRGQTPLHTNIHNGWFKPTDRRRDLVKGAALILAEIERLDRAEARAKDAALLPPTCGEGGRQSRSGGGAP